jgi:regulator of protease activity HflC (stomatin/prohibitin superfamily)
MYLVLAGFLLLFVLGGLLAFLFTKSGTAAAVGGFAAFLLIVLTLIFSVNIIPARTVAIQTTFGTNPTALNPGWYMLAPWSETERFETLLQPLDLNDKDDSQGNAVNVTFSAPKTETVGADGKTTTSPDEAGGGKGKINAVINWRISEQDKNGPVRLWQVYKSFDRVTKELVSAKAQTEVMDVAQDLPAGVASVNNAKIASEVKTRLGNVLRPYGVEVVDVSVYGVDLDAATQASLQKIVDNINRTRAYEEELKGAQVQSKILKEQRDNQQLSAEAQVRFCLNIVNSWDVKTNGPLPATFNCGLGGNVNPLLTVK